MEFRTKYKGPCMEHAGKLVAIPVMTRYQRPIVNTDKCCHCGTCYFFCSSGCISDQGSYYAVSNVDFCKGCGVCAKECPVHAIRLVRERV